MAHRHDIDVVIPQRGSDGPMLAGDGDDDRALASTDDDAPPSSAASITSASPSSQGAEPTIADRMTEIAGCFCPDCRSDGAVTTVLFPPPPLSSHSCGGGVAFASEEDGEYDDRDDDFGNCDNAVYDVGAVMSLSCPDCGFRSGGEASGFGGGGNIADRGIRLELTASSASDLNRIVVKSDVASVVLPDILRDFDEDADFDADAERRGKDLEIPAGTQAGVTTIEGLLRRCASNLKAGQSVRLKLGDVDNFRRCHEAIEALRHVLDADQTGGGGAAEHSEEGTLFRPFCLVLDDPSGNSRIESVAIAVAVDDPQLRVRRYVRTPAQDAALGLLPSPRRTPPLVDEEKVVKAEGTMGDCFVPAGNKKVQEDSVDDDGNADVGSGSKGGHIDGPKPLSGRTTTSMGDEGGELPLSSLSKSSIANDEVISFPTPCPQCSHPDAQTNACVTNIPHFKEIVLLCLSCESCGYRFAEIKGGGGIPPRGARIALRATDVEDLKREVLVSDSAEIGVPELGLESGGGGGCDGGAYTTVEGLLRRMHDRLSVVDPFGRAEEGDGIEWNRSDKRRVKYVEFLNKLEEAAEGRLFPFELIISDPLSNSFIGPRPGRAPTAADGSAVKSDVGLSLEEYERSHAENDLLGLNDMQTEDYA